MSSSSRTHRRRIGEILVNEGLVSQEQLEEALRIQKKTGELLGSVLMDMGLVAESDIAKTMCLQYQLPFITLQNYEFDEKLLQLFPKEFLHKHRLLPFDKVGDMLLVLVTEIPGDQVLEEIPKLTHLNTGLYVGYLSEVTNQLNKLIPLAQPAAPAKPAAKKEKVSAAAAAPVKGIAPLPEDDVEEQDGATLVFGSSKESFLEELDSTWDSIFEQAENKVDPRKSEKR
jgi:type IV pilus assembly protein PilB